MTQKTIILDRDGVINKDSTLYITSVAALEPIDGALEAMATLTQSGWQVCIATNQSGVARGYFSEETLHGMHDKLRQLLAPLGGQISYIAYCPHMPDAGCACRKPGIGMIQEIAAHTGCDLTRTPFVGDSLKDMQAAITAGCPPKLVKTGNGMATQQRLKQMAVEIPTYTNLMDVIEHLDL